MLLLCSIIHPIISGVDTNFMMQSSIMGPGIADISRVNVSHLVVVEDGVYEKTVTFSYLIEADAGSYNCSAFTTLSHLYVTVGDSTSSSEAIRIERKQWYRIDSDTTHYSLFQTPHLACVLYPCSSAGPRGDCFSNPISHSGW